MAVRLLGRGNQHEPRVFHLLDFPFGDSKLGRVDEVVGGIDEHDRRLDFLKLRRGIVVPRSIHLIEQVVGIENGQTILERVLQIFVGCFARGELLLHGKRSVAGNEQEIERGAQGFFRLLRVLAAFPGGIAADRVHHHLAPHAVAPGDLHGEAGKGHERVHEARIRFSPDERVHAAHGRAHDESQVIDAEAFGDQAKMRRDHVVVVILREARVEAVAGLRGFSVADAVGKNDEIARRVEKLAGTEELSCELRLKELPPGAAGAVKDQDGVRDPSLRVAGGFPERHVVQAQLGHSFPRAKLELMDYEVPLCCGRHREPRAARDRLLRNRQRANEARNNNRASH